ncbi:MAG TPA: hypothetical protein VM914_02130 [Pyrinomonadaceae bacterium]|nr:hypothetical protein [Pyrinomonadaceae bacterium]
MSDFLKSLVARQLGEAPSVRPRLAGRFEPPPDAFAPQATRRAGESEESAADALELFLEVETHAAPARDATTRQDRHEDARPHELRHEGVEKSTRVVTVREPREESPPVLRQERGTRHDSERTHEASSPSHVTDSRPQTRERDVGGAHVRPRSIVPASDDEDLLIRPDARTDERTPLVTRARARDERAETSSSEPREPSMQEVDEAKRPLNVVRPIPPPPHAPREAAAAPRADNEELLSLSSEFARELERRRDDSDESRASLQARRAREASNAIEPRPARRRERQAAARDSHKERAEAAPTINVNIGRVEVRATQAPAPAQRRAETAAPRMSLDDYLRRRNGEVRE